MAQEGIISSTKMEVLSKDNYDTWKIHVDVLLVKNDMQAYVSGIRTNCCVERSSRKRSRTARSRPMERPKSKSKILTDQRMPYIERGLGQTRIDLRFERVSHVTQAADAAPVQIFRRS